MSYSCRLAIFLLPLLLSSCWVNQHATSVEHPRDDSPKDQRAEPVLSDDIAVFQVRLAIGVDKQQSSTVIDYEIIGPGRSAKQICDALVLQEVSVVFPPDTNLKTFVLRPCEISPLLEPDADSSYALVRVNRLTPVDLHLALSLKPDVKVDAVQVRRREMSGYQNQEACESALIKIRQSEEKQAKDSAIAFLDTQISRQEKSQREACSKNKRDKECKVAELLLTTLKDHRTQLQSGNSISPNGTLICRKW